MKLLKSNKLASGLILSFSIVLLVTIENFAQSGIFSKKNKLNQYSTVGIGGGSSHYFGDLSPYGSFYYGLITTVRWNATINYTRQLSPQIAARVGFTWARIAGDDYTYSQHNINKFSDLFLRNLHFRNDIKEFSLTGLFNLLPQYSKGPQGRSHFMPYTFIGLGFLAHNPQAKADVGKLFIPYTQDIQWVNLKEQRTSGQGVTPNAPKPYSLVQPVFPVGLGVKIKLNEKFDLGLEGGVRITPFDYLDDVGDTDFPDPNILSGAGYTLGSLLSNRTNEDFSAFTGASRVADFVNISGITNGTPSVNGLTIYGYSANSHRGPGRKWDTYFTTQITLSYVISNQVKCPPIK